MRILFLHQSFPGQFQYLAGALAKLPQTKVLFLAERQRREVKIPGVRSLTIPPAKPVVSEDAAEREMLLAARRGANTANVLLHLQREGFRPDMLCYSSGGGYGLYVADIFPEAFRAVYADWFYTKGANYTFFSKGRPRSPADFAPGRARNWCQYNALNDCDLSFTFTHWQQEQFPPSLAKPMRVLHQGVDTEFFSPGRKGASLPACPLPPHAELVTFAGRSLEPFRGFGQFSQSISAVLAARPHCHVLIMAGATTGGKARENAVEQAALPEALQHLTAEEQKRVHFLGFRPYAEYRALLRASTVHVYLTAPFALSSGLFEAMSCGCLVVGADTEPVREVIRHAENGFLCDFWDTQALADTVIALLERSAQMQPIRQAARRSIEENYNIQKQGPQLVRLLQEHYAAWKSSRP